MLKSDLPPHLFNARRYLESPDDAAYVQGVLETAQYMAPTGTVSEFKERPLGMTLATRAMFKEIIVTAARKPRDGMDFNTWDADSLGYHFFDDNNAYPVTKTAKLGRLALGGYIDSNDDYEEFMLCMHLSGEGLPEEVRRTREAFRMHMGRYQQKHDIGKPVLGIGRVKITETSQQTAVDAALEYTNDLLRKQPPRIITLGRPTVTAVEYDREMLWSRLSARSSREEEWVLQ